MKMKKKSKKIKFYEVRTNGRLTKTFRSRKVAKAFALQHKLKNIKKKVILLDLEKNR